MTKGDLKDAIEAIVNTAVPGSAEHELDEGQAKAVCNGVTEYLVNTVNPDKKTYPSIRF